MRGKGSHGTLYFGDRHSVVKDRRKPLKDRYAPRHVQATRHRPERPSGISDHGNAIQLPPSIFTRSERAAFQSPSPDFEEAVTDGDTFAEAIAEAADCLEEALAGRMARREDIPSPSPARGRPAAVPGAVLAAKAALYEALREEALSNSAFAAAMGIQESEVRRMLDPHHATKIGRLEKALARFKKRLVVTVEEGVTA